MRGARFLIELCNDFTVAISEDDEQARYSTPRLASRRRQPADCRRKYLLCCPTKIHLLKEHQLLYHCK